MGGGSAQSTGNPLDLQIQGEGFFRVGERRRRHDGADHARVHPRRQLHDQHARLPDHAAGRVRDREERGRHRHRAEHYVLARAPTDSYINVPPGSTDIAVGQDGSVTYVDQNHGQNAHVSSMRVTAGYISLATFPNESGLERARRLAVAADVELGRRDGRDPGRQRHGQRRSRASSRCPTSTWRPSSRT